MHPVNRSRVLIGGVVGGLVIFGIMGAMNHLFLQRDWSEWMNRMGALLQQQTPQRSMVLWLLQSLIVGVTGVTVYAGVRTRFGAGPRTAIWVGLWVWILVHVSEMYNELAMGVLTRRIIFAECLAGLVATLVGIYVAAAIYRE